MPWHLSKSDPRKVYDSYHNMVCVCQTAEQAKLVVDSVNECKPQPETIKLREPIQHPDILPPVREIPLTHVTVQAEGCCAKLIAKASISGALDRMQPWECPKCGTTYWPRRERPLVNWEARAAALVFKQ
jgi:hypothetical protein